MQIVQKLKILIGFYLSVLVILMLSVVAMPLLVRHSLTLTSQFVIEEERLETLLIAILFVASYLILKAFKRTLRAYENAVNRAGKEKSRLISRLTEAFTYIGTVNVELKEIQSILCGVEHYPQTKKEFKQCAEALAAKAMTVTGTAWIVIRLINPSSCRTVKEYAVAQPNAVVPSITIGNRAVVDGHRVKGLRTVVTHRNNPDLLTVCIFPQTPLSEEQIVLLTAIASRIEMFFMLYQAGCRHLNTFNSTDHPGKEISHDTYH
jgi:hypothetical protein